MPPQPERNENIESEAQRLTLGFECGRFTAGDEVGKKEWVATAVRIAERRESTRNTIAIVLALAFVAAFPALGLRFTSFRI